MDVWKAIKNRRSITSFLDKDVEKEKIGKILEACRWAPSAGNRQPWEIVVVKDLDKKEKISKAAFDQNFLAEAPVVLVVCINMKIAKLVYGERGELYSIQSTAAAVQNMLLTAYSEGLGSCWVGAFKEEQIQRILNCPKHIRPVALIPIGYYKHFKNPLPRRDLNTFSHYNSYGKKYEAEWGGLEKEVKKLKGKLSRKLRRSLEEF